MPSIDRPTRTPLACALLLAVALPLLPQAAQAQSSSSVSTSATSGVSSSASASSGSGASATSSATGSGGSSAQASANASAGLVTRSSRHGVRETLDRFAAAVRAGDFVVFHEIDHAAAAREVGLTLPARTVVLFGNPRTGTPAMAANPTLAIDLPLRVLVWEDSDGIVQITRSSGADMAERVFARHGVVIPIQAQRAMDAVIAGFVAQAAE